MTRVTHVSYTDDTFTFAVETCHLVHRYQHSRTACVFWLQRIKPIWAQDYSSVPQNKTAILSNTLTCGNTFQWTAIVMVTAARTKDLTKRFLAWWRTDSQFQSIWHLINLIQDWWWTHPANLTHHQQMKHQVCECFCIITGSNGQLLLCAMADGIHMALLTISCFLST